MNINFTIISVTYNSKKNLLKTIDSVQSQTNNNFIHIIKDGLSNDKTDEIDFSKYRNTEFFKSRDKGVYDAMNQAFSLSKNEYIIYLNAGDTFFSKNTLKDLAKNIKNNPNFNSYSGGTLQINMQEKKINRIIGVGKLYKIFPLAQLPHPSFIVRRSTLSKLNYPFDSRLKISADYKLQLILRKKKLWKNCFLDQITTIMPTGGISTLNKKSIIFGYKELFFFSNKPNYLVTIYLILTKLILNFYSRIETIKIKDSIISNDFFN